MYDIWYNINERNHKGGIVVENNSNEIDENLDNEFQQEPQIEQPRNRFFNNLQAGPQQGRNAIEGARNTIDKSVAAMRNTANIVQFIVLLVINPKTWIAIAGFLLVVTVVAFFQVFGQSDFNQGCSHNGSSSISLEHGLSTEANVEAIGGWLMNTPFQGNGNQPMSRVQALGMLGNIAQESGPGLNWKAMQYSGATWETCDNQCVLSWGGQNVGSDGRAIGLIQWDGVRRHRLVTFAESIGQQWYELEVQLMFLAEDTNELNSPSRWRGQADAMSFDDSVRAWQNAFFAAGTPMIERRIDFANSFSEFFTGTGIVGGQRTSSRCVGSGIRSFQGMMIRPVETARIISAANEFGASRSGGVHNGTDIAPFPVQEPVPVVAVADGTVTHIVRGYISTSPEQRSCLSNACGGWGNYVVVSHVINGQSISSLYSHLHEVENGLSIGQSVRQGEQLGLVGNSGSVYSMGHLHFEIWEGGAFTGTRVQPRNWINFPETSVPWHDHE